MIYRYSKRTEGTDMEGKFLPGNSETMGKSGSLAYWPLSEALLFTIFNSS